MVRPTGDVKLGWWAVALVCMALASACGDDLGDKLDRVNAASVENHALHCSCSRSPDCGRRESKLTGELRACYLDVLERDREFTERYLDCWSEYYDVENECLSECASQDTLPCDRLGDEIKNRCPELPEDWDDALDGCERAD